MSGHRVIHLTFTGANAGKVLCGAPRQAQDAEYLHAAHAGPKTMNDPDLHPLCKHVWECENKACEASDHELWERTKDTLPLF